MASLVCAESSRQPQSQLFYAVSQLKLALQAAGVNEQAAAKIAANADSLDGASDARVSVQAYYDYKLHERMVDQYLCKIPSYRDLGFTPSEQGLVQSGCRFTEIYAAKEVLGAHLNPCYVESVPESYPQPVESAYADLHAFAWPEVPDTEVGYADVGFGVVLATLLANRSLPQFLSELREAARASNNGALQSLAARIGYAVEFVLRYEREIIRELGPEGLQRFVASHPTLQAMSTRVGELIVMVRNQGANTTNLNPILTELTEGMQTLSQQASVLRASALQAARANVPELVAAVESNSGIGAAWQQAVNNSAVQSMRNTSFNNPYAKPLIIGAVIVAVGAAIWIWASD